MSKYEVVLDWRGTGIRSAGGDLIIEAARIQRADGYLTLSTRVGELVATFPLDRVVSIVKLDTDPLELQLKEAKEAAEAFADQAGGFATELKELRKANNYRCVIYKQRRFRPRKWVATIDTRNGLNISSDTGYFLDVDAGELGT